MGRRSGVDMRHRRAMAMMAGAVMFFSTNALFVELTLGDNHPFLYNGAVWLGTGLGLGGVLLLLYRPVLADVTARRLMVRRVAGLKVDGARRWDLPVMVLLMTVGRFAFAFFPWATQYVETATVAVLHYTWPVFFVLGLSRWDRKNRKRYRRLTAVSWSGLGLAFVGMAAVVVGTLGFESTGATLSARVLGMVLAMISALLLVCTVAAGYPLAASLATEVALKANIPISRHGLEFACLLFGYSVSAVVAVIPNALIGLGSGGRITVESVAWAMAVGLSFVPGAVLSRKATLITPDLSINAYIYTAPVVGLLWLGMFTEISVARMDLLVIGALTVAAANTLLSRTGVRPLRKFRQPRVPSAPG